jgi:hypothetical protein
MGTVSTFGSMPPGATLPLGKPPYEMTTFGSGSQNFA